VAQHDAQAREARRQEHLAWEAEELTWEREREAEETPAQVIGSRA